MRASRNGLIPAQAAPRAPRSRSAQYVDDMRRVADSIDVGLVDNTFVFYVDQSPSWPNQYLTGTG